MKRLPTNGMVFIQTPEWEGYFVADSYNCDGGWNFYRGTFLARRFWNVYFIQMTSSLTSSGPVPICRYRTVPSWF